MAKGKLLTKSVYLPEKIVERIELNKEDNDSFSSSLTKLLKLGIESKNSANNSCSNSKKLLGLEDLIYSLKVDLRKDNFSELIETKLDQFSSLFLEKFSNEIEEKFSFLNSEYEKILEEKFEKFRDGLNKISKYIISTEEGIKFIKNNITENKNTRS